MNAARVHAVVAAALDNTQFLEQLMKDPELVREYGVDPAQFDWQGLWNFAGISTKVRHNPLRDILPLTFRVLKATGLEVDAFSHYAPHAAALRVNGVYGTDEKIQSLYSFLEGWLDYAENRHALVWDVLRHETTLATLRNSDVASVASHGPVQLSELATSAVPGICGRLELLSLSFDPATVEEQVLGQKVALSDLQRGEVQLGYSLNKQGDRKLLRLISLDPLGFHLLEQTDGVTDIATIRQRMLLAGIQVECSELLAAFYALYEQEVIRFRAGTT